MPCMNSTSAADFGGRAARVDGGSLLLGAPGAPGCTTTGCPGLVCCAHMVRTQFEDKPAARTARITNVEMYCEVGSPWTETRIWRGVRGRMFIQTRKQSFHETGNSST